MSAPNITLTALRGNDATFALQVVSNGIPVDVTSLTLKFYVKASATADDATATVYLTTTGISVIKAKLGQISVTIPHTANTTAGVFWWRLDTITAGGAVTTAMFGPYYILAV
jgi:hypothetical protein